MKNGIMTPAPPPPPDFQIGDHVWRNSTNPVGVVTEIKRWGAVYGYRITGAGFHPRQYFSQSILSDAEGKL